MLDMWQLFLWINKQKKPGEKPILKKRYPMHWRINPELFWQFTVSGIIKSFWSIFLQVVATLHVLDRSTPWPPPEDLSSSSEAVGQRASGWTTCTSSTSTPMSGRATSRVQCPVGVVLDLWRPLIINRSMNSYGWYFSEVISRRSFEYKWLS